MARHPCSSCGRLVNPSAPCPYCGAENAPEDELERIQRSIAEMSRREKAIVNERSRLASKMQAAQFQRDILADANRERLKRTTRANRTGRRPRAAQADPGSPGVTTDGVTLLVDDPPPVDPTVDEPASAALPEPQPEASPRSVQNVLLGLGALLLAVAAVVFAGVAISSLEAVGRAMILLTGTAVALSVAAPLARRGLTSTAETVAVIGLALVPMAGWALYGQRALGGETISEQLYLGVTFTVSAVVAFGYAGAVRLAAPRYATVVAVQPVLPLLGYEIIEGPAGWAFAFTLVAALDLILLTTLIRRGRLVPQWPEGRPEDSDRPDTLDPDSPHTPDRPETAPEEPDLVIQALAPPRRRWWRPPRVFAGPRPVSAPPAGAAAETALPSTPPSAKWLRELTTGLIAAWVGIALFFGTAALLRADLTGDAVRAGAVVVLAALTAVAAARVLRDDRAQQVAGAVLTLAVIGAAARIAAVAAPGRTMLVAAAVVAMAGLVVRLLPDDVRLGPQRATAAALAVIGVVVAADALRVAIAPVAAARPVWRADTAAYAGRIAETVGPASWQLVASALLLTLAAALALPSSIRHESAVVGVALTALAVPASLRLPWSEAPWPLVVGAVGLGATGLLARSHRVAIAHLSAAAIVGAFGAGAALATPWLTAAVLTALTGAGLMVALTASQVLTRLYAWLVGDWAAGAAAFALPGAVAAAGVALAGPGALPPPTRETTVPIMAATFVAVAATLAYAAVTQVARREISTPLTVGTGLGALAVTVAAFRAPGAAGADRWVGALLLVAAVLLFFAPSIDASRRADRIYDGPDVAAAAATVGIIGALSRVAALLYPAAELVATAGVVLLIAVAVRAMPVDWRRGPVLGTTLGGAILLLIAGYSAVREGLRALSMPGPIWGSDVSGWPAVPPEGLWQVPVALVLLAVAATAALPRPAAYDVAAVCAGLATISAPTSFGLPWWSPLLVGGAVMFGYGVAAVAAHDPRAALARAALACAVGLHTVVSGLARPWTTAGALAVVVIVGSLVAWLARVEAGDRPVAPTTAVDGRPIDLALDDTGMPRHLGQIGAAATAGTLLALPGVFAAVAAAERQPAQVVLTAALAASSISLAVLALLGRWIPQYLPAATVGIVGGASITALVSLPTEHPTALYAAAAALLGVVAELLRGATAAPGVTVAPPRPWIGGSSVGTRWTNVRPIGLRGRWSVDPATGALAVAALPTALAVASLAPVLVAALVDPFQQLSAIWQGPVSELTNPMPGSEVDGTSVLAAVLLTVAATLAALGFGGRAAESVPVILPGLAVTLLIAPIALTAPWPASTSAGLTVFTVSMLGLALTPPPIASRAPLLRATRAIVFGIGLLAGGAGLAGSLATQPLTLFTLGSAVFVGLTAAIAGRTEIARILGWLFAAVAGQSFVVTAGLVAGLEPAWTSFGVLAVGTALLILEAALPRLGRPEHAREATAVEWSGYASALLAFAFAYDSPRHLAALLAACGAVLGLAAARTGRGPQQRRTLFWMAVGLEIAAWWLLMTLSDVVLPEAYTLPFAGLALIVGVVAARQRPELSSWAAYGPALLATFVPTVGMVLATDTSDLREVLLLLGGVSTLIIGSRLQQQAPVVVGAAVTAITALHFTVTLVGPWVVLVPVGVILLVLGAGNETQRRRTQDRLRGVGRMR